MDPTASHSMLPSAQSAAPDSVLARKLGLRDGDALIVVDVQKDFLPGGQLAIAHASDIIPRINIYIATFAARAPPIFLTRDWHPTDHCSFQLAGGQWPEHCVQGSEGAKWPSELQVPKMARIVSKGVTANSAGYSAFDGTTLLVQLRAGNVLRVFVAGLATDYCARTTVLDALQHGFDVVVLADAIGGVDLQSGDSRRALDEVLEQGAGLFPSAPG